MIDYQIFEEMTIPELEMYLETGEIPVRKEVNGKLPKTTKCCRNKGETPIRDNYVTSKKGKDPVKATNGDEDDFMKEYESSDIRKEACKSKVTKNKIKEEACKSKKKKLVEPNEIEKESEALEENSFDIDEEYSLLMKEEERELELFDEELEDIESFIENYELFMED